MKTIQEYLSGHFDEELRVAVAEARGWIHKNDPSKTRADEWWLLPPYSTSRDACEGLLADLTLEEGIKLVQKLVGFLDDIHADGEVSPLVCMSDVSSPVEITFRVLLAAPRQICVAYLIVKGVLR